jgi:hypothetical protein
MAAHQIALQGLQLIVWDWVIGEPAEAGVHAIDDVATLKNALDTPARSSHAIEGTGGELSRLVTACNPRDIVQ